MDDDDISLAARRLQWQLSELDLPGIIAVSDDLSLVSTHQGEFLFTIQKPLPPPAGYASWLDYAVESFSTRQAWLESLWETWVDDTAVELDRDEIRESARLELRALRKAAAAAGS